MTVGLLCFFIMTYRLFDTAACQELATLYAASNGSITACEEHFSNEGYDLAMVRSALQVHIHQPNLPTAPEAPCPVPTRANTPPGAKLLFELKDPHVMLWSGFLSHEECDHLLSLGGESFNRSQVCDPTGDIYSDARTSATAYINLGQDQIVQTIEERIATTVNWPVRCAECMQLVQYQVGQQYMPHMDFFEVPGSVDYLITPQFQRTATMILYLEEPEEGGDTSLTRVGLNVPVHKGHALFFSYPNPGPNHNTLHAGEPVVRGVKTIATKWFKTLQHGL